MNNYRINQRLGKGAQGSVFLVKHKGDGKEYVLKKIECNDETEANKAFNEAKALNQLQHRYICGYKEFFVTWDKEESAMFVCIVMDYYRMGDLDKALKQNRSSSKSLEELVLKKWFGQMLEAIIFVHQKNVIHRDLKPSNILVTEDLNISIGDFGVSTVMGESRTKARTTVGSMNWMAPEVLERPYDERSDVWSMGCILLEMATCSILDYSQVSELLMEIKKRPQALEDALEQISKIYNPALSQILRTMLRLNFQQRTTALDLIELPYVKECLALNKSPLLDDSEDASPTIRQSSSNIKPMFKENSVAGMMAYMRENTSNPQSQIAALEFLIDMLHERPKQTFTEADKLSLGELMRKHIGNIDVQVLSCKLLTMIAAAADGKEDDVLFSRKLISPVALSMKSHPASVDLQAAATQLFTAISVVESAASEIGRLGGVQDTLAALRNFPNNKDIAKNCCSALWSLSIDEANAKIVTEECGLQDICKAMDSHENEAELIEAACAAIWSLALEAENIEMMSDYGTIQLLLHALKRHKDDAKVVKNACMALATIVDADEALAYDLLRGDDDTPGCAILVNAFTSHKNNEEVVENFACCVTELGHYEELRNEMKAKNIHTMLSDTKLKFSTNSDVLNQINNAIASFGENNDGILPNDTMHSRPKSVLRT